jgi:hypothetical protein
MGWALFKGSLLKYALPFGNQAALKETGIQDTGRLLIIYQLAF